MPLDTTLMEPRETMVSKKTKMCEEATRKTDLDLRIAKNPPREVGTDKNRTWGQGSINTHDIVNKHDIVDKLLNIVT